MLTPYIVVLVWIISGVVTWKVATRRSGSGPLWAVIGQVFGPLSIPFAFLVKPQAS
jgi:hypothetical protein